MFIYSDIQLQSSSWKYHCWTNRPIITNFHSADWPRKSELGNDSSKLSAAATTIANMHMSKALTPSCFNAAAPGVPEDKAKIKKQLPVVNAITD